MILIIYNNNDYNNNSYRPEFSIYNFLFPPLDINREHHWSLKGKKKYNRI